MKKKTFAQFIIPLFLLIEGFYGLTKGVEHHETWRIWMASVALMIGIFFIAFLAKRIFKKEQKTF